MKGDLGRCALKGAEQMKLAEVESIVCAARITKHG
jgi:hypothetical protein